MPGLFAAKKLKQKTTFQMERRGLQKKSFIIRC